MPSIYSQTTSHPLDVVVVGCGVGGLAVAWCLGEAGHHVTVLEAAVAIGEVGAGIQLSPNLTKLLIRWGLGDKLKELAVIPEAITFRRWTTGERIGWTKWGSSMEEEYGAPYCHIHRADFHKLLFNLASQHMDLRLNSRVISVSFDSVSHRPSVGLANGTVLSADLVIGADGVKSTLREIVVGKPDRPVDTGDAAYRAIVQSEDMVKDPLLKELVEFPEMTGWMGPGKHIMGYLIRGRKEYNVVMIHPDDGFVESWETEGCIEKMRADFEGWEPRVQKLTSLVSTTLNWKLFDRSPLKTWVHPEGTLALLGDACHPMLPYRAQGSAMAVEDAAVLGNLFSHLKSPADIPILLRAYERLRLWRTSETQASSRLNQRIFHLKDGQEQELRDRSMTAAMVSARIAAGMPLEGLRFADGNTCKNENKGNPNQWADQTKNVEQFSYDADVEAESWWREEGYKSLARSEGGH